MEILVAIGIFVVMGGALVTMWRLGLRAWSVGERRRKTYERAQEALRAVAVDLAAAYTRDPMADGVPTARFFCTRDPSTGLQRLSFVRTFETGPERAFAFYAGSGGGKAYTAGYVGDGSDLKAMGGLLGVSYFQSGRKLMRAMSGPPTKNLLTPAGSGGGEVVVDDVLFLGFRFWTQYTDSWSDPPEKEKNVRFWRWPETVWDSTRGAGDGVFETDPASGRRRLFALARGRASLDYPADDVFPEIVEVTLVVEPEKARAVRTELIEAVSMSATKLRVASTHGFPAPSEGPTYILVGDVGKGEWMRYKAKGDRSFDLDARGLRRTPRGSHARGTQVRIGTTFVMRMHVPAGRPDWSSDADFRRRARP